MPKFRLSVLLACVFLAYCEPAIVRAETGENSAVSTTNTDTDNNARTDSSEFEIDPFANAGDGPIILEALQVLGKLVVTAQLKLDFSYLYKSRHGRYPNLYSYITDQVNIFDFPSYSGVYNLNFRGVQTSPFNQYLPASVKLDGVEYKQGDDIPINVYHLGLASYASGMDSLGYSSEGGAGLAIEAKNFNRYRDPEQTAKLLISSQKADITYKTYFGKKGHISLSTNIRYIYGEYENKVSLPVTAYRSYRENLLDYYKEAPLDNQLHANLFLDGYYETEAESYFKPYLSLIYMQRGFLHGYQTSVDNFEQQLSKEEIEELNQFETAPINDTFIANLGVIGSVNFNSSALDYNIRGQAKENNLYYDLDSSSQFIDGGFLISGRWDEMKKIQGLSAELKWKGPESDTSLANLALVLDAKPSIETNTTQTITSHSSGFVSNEVSTFELQNTASHYTAQLQASYDMNLGESFKFNLGLRAFAEEYSFSHQQDINSNYDNSPLGFVGGVNLRLEDIGSTTRYEFGTKNTQEKYSSTSLLPKLQIQTYFRDEEDEDNYKLLELHAYSSVIPGGANPYRLSDGNKHFYQSQLNNSLELSWKSRSETKEGVDRFRLTAFFIDMQDVHYQSSINGLEVYYGNAESAISQGLELSYVDRLTRKLEVRLEGTHQIAKYKNFTHDAITNSQADPLLDYSDKFMINSPQNSFRFALDYWPKYTWYFSLEYKHVGEHYFDYANELKSPGYGLLNLNIGYDKSKGFMARFFVENLLATSYVQGAEESRYNASGQVLADTWNGLGNSERPFEWQNVVRKIEGDPLTFGIEFSAGY